MVKHFTLLCLFVGMGMSVLTAQQPAAGAPGASAAAAMDATRVLLQKWAETEKMIAAERGEWEQGKALLEGRITLVKQSVEEIKKKIAETEAKLAEARKRADEVAKEKKEAKEASTALLAVAPELEDGVRGLIERVPNGVKEKVRVLADRMPKPGADTKNISAAERFQNVLGILNEMNKANLEIASLPEIHEVAAGKRAEVKTIYIGLGQGYFVNSAGDLAGVGRPAQGEWLWTTKPELAKSMVEVVDVMKKTTAPHFVQLPATIE